MTSSSRSMRNGHRPGRRQPRQKVPCHRCQKPVDRDRAVRRVDGELYHLGCPGRY